MNRIQQFFKFITKLFTFGPSEEDLLEIARESEAKRILKEKEEQKLLDEKEELRLKKINDEKKEELEKLRILSEQKEKEIQNEKDRLYALEEENKRLATLKEEKKQADIIRRKDLMAKEILRLRKEKETLKERKAKKLNKDKDLEKKRLENKATRIITKKKETILEERKTLKKTQADLLKEADENNRKAKEISEVKEIEEIPEIKLPILIVEDSIINQKIMKGVLSQFDIETVIVSNGQEAVDKRIEMDFALILMDIEMPIKNGVDASKEIFAFETINKKDESIIIALTSNDKDEHINEYISVGMKECISKPINAEGIKEILIKYNII